MQKTSAGHRIDGQPVFGQVGAGGVRAFPRPAVLPSFAATEVGLFPGAVFIHHGRGGREFGGEDIETEDASRRAGEFAPGAVVSIS